MASYFVLETDTLRTFPVPVSFTPGSGKTLSRIADLAAHEPARSGEPENFDTELQGAYPNPFNPVATIAYALAEEDQVRIVVYDALGRRVAVLEDGIQAAGKHAAVFNTEGFQVDCIFCVWWRRRGNSTRRCC